MICQFPRLTAVMVVCICVGLGCQSYEPLPVDLVAHEAAWKTRSPDSADVLAFAKRLETTEPERTRNYNAADGVSLAEAEVVALLFNPDLRRRRLAALVPLASFKHAEDWPDIELAIDGAAILENVPSAFVLGGTFNLTIPISGRLGAEKDRELVKHGLAVWQARVAETEALSLLRETWIEWSAALESQKAITAHLAEIEAVLPLVQRRFEAGELGRMDLRLFELERAKWRAEVLRLKYVATMLSLQLTQLMGLVPTAPIHLLPSLDTGLPVLSAAQRLERVSSSPQLNLALQEHAAAEATLRVEIRKQYPDITIGTGFASDQGQSRIAFGLGLPIPSLNLNRRGIAEAMTERDVTKAGAEGMYEWWVHQLAQAENTAAGAREQREYLVRDVIPLTESQVADALRLAELGQFDALVALDAFRQRHEANLSVIQVRTAEAVSQIRLYSLSGRTWPVVNAVQAEKSESSADQK